MDARKYVDYADKNLYNSKMSPSEIHVTNTRTAAFFRRYLYQRAMSVFKWSLPESINPYYFNFVLWRAGYIGLFNHEDFGSLALWGSLRDYDVYYYPKTMMFTSPVFSTPIERRINEDCVVLNLKGDFTGIDDLVFFYADQLALLYQSLGINVLNNKTSNVFACSSKASAESFKKMVDEIDKGLPNVFIDKDLLNDNGDLAMTQFAASIPYLADSILVDVQKVIKMFDTEIGIPAVNTEKKERMITAEAEKNDIETYSRIDMWLEHLQEECKKAKELLDIDISVELRYNKERRCKENDRELLDDMGSVEV